MLPGGISGSTPDRRTNAGYACRMPERIGREGEIMTDADAIIVATHILGCWGLHGRAVPDSNIVRAVRAELAPEYPTDAEVEAVAAAVRRLREQA